MTRFEEVREFHEAFGQTVGETPWFRDVILRLALIKEEVKELTDALDAFDFVAAIDALGDINYVVNGTGVAWGVDLDAVGREIHRSNMTKLDENSKPIYREDGKVLKSDLYEPPELQPIIDAGLS